MATTNPFDLLGDDDNDDPSLVVVSAQVKVDKPKKPAAPMAAAAQAKPAKSAQLPIKPPPASQAVKEARNEGGRGGRGGGRGYSRGRGERTAINRDGNENNGFSGDVKPREEGDAGKPSEKRGYGAPRGSRGGGGRRGGFSNGDSAEGERPRRVFDRRSGTGRGNEFKRDGAGRGNWGTPSDEVAPDTEELVIESEKNVDIEKPQGEEEAADANKDSPVNESEEKEPEEKEMTLQEYEKVLEEKRKALLALKTEERKVDTKVFESMQQLASKKENDEIFIKLGSEKDKRKDAADKEERAKKSVSINEFLKPADGERYYGSGGRGRGRGRGSRGVYGGGNARDVAAPSIEDPGQFPTLGGGK